jgi:uncharacterized protein YwqG
MSTFFDRLFGKKEESKPVRDISALVAPFATPAVHVVHTGSLSLSHFGGSPSLPPDVGWPEKDGVKLGFLARISLTEIHNTHPVSWLPESGSLLFFYDLEQQPWGFDPKNRGSWAVLLVSDLASPIEQPENEPNDIESPISHQNISFRRIDTYPSWEHDSIHKLKLSNEESDKFLELSERPYQGMPHHQVSGLPNPVQGDDMELQCQLVSNGLYCGDASGYKDSRAPSLAPGAANWRLLFQVDSDDDLGLIWGDCGMIYFWIEESAAKVGDFSNSWLVLQCS